MKHSLLMKHGLAFDRSVRRVDADGRLRVATSPITKATVNPYYGREIPDHENLGLHPDKIYYLLRDPKELQKAVASFNNLPLLIKHQPVCASDHPKELVVGTTGSNATWRAPYIDVDLTIWDAAAIAGIESKEQTELSSAYRYTADMTPGVYQAMRYDGVMRDITGNHVALVDVGRAGRDVVVQDGNPFYTHDGQVDDLDNNNPLFQNPNFKNSNFKNHTSNNMIYNKHEDHLMSDSNPRQAAATKSAQSALQQLAPQLDVDAVAQILAQLLADSGQNIGQDDDDELYASPEDEEAEDMSLPPMGRQFNFSNQNKTKQVNQQTNHLDDGISLLDINPDDDTRAKNAYLNKKQQEREQQEKLKQQSQQKLSNKSITQDAMLVAEQRAVRRIEALYQARDTVKPLVGKVALDSAEAVYRFALEQAGIATAGVHPSAYRAMTHMLLNQKGQQASSPQMGMDARMNKSLNNQYPHLARFKQA